MKLHGLFRFDKVGNLRVIPVSLKIVIILVVFIVASNITTNYASLVFSRINQIYFTKQLLIKDLKEISNFSNLQWQIYNLNGDMDSALRSIREKSAFELKKTGSLILGFTKDGSVIFSSLDTDSEIELNIEGLFKNSASGGNPEQDFDTLYINNKKYFGVYKHNHNWDFYLFRGEEEDAFYESSWQNFFIIIVVILFITLFSAIAGIYAIRYLLRFIGIITSSIMEMTKHQKLTPIPLHGASNDDVTYMGLSFNVLSQNMDMLVNIFKKFTDRDVVKKAYTDKEVRLEGERRDLTMLFTDIKNYTHMTETLGPDIIKLLNIQYEHAIGSIYNKDGSIASIIGDALLAVFGVMDSDRNRSHAALLAGKEILESTRKLQNRMKLKKEELIRENGALNEEEEDIYQAVLVDVGIGIDSGDVFYGTIGSQLRMTTTVIGDKVNAAARLEALTRLYEVPMICSESVEYDVRSQVDVPFFDFIKLDRVQVKGKTKAIDIFWPVPKEDMTPDLKQQLDIFSTGLDFYLKGNWEQANIHFSECKLPVAEMFFSRTKECVPEKWEGVWVLNTK